MTEATETLTEKTTATIVDVLRLRAETQKDQIAYRFLADGEEEKGTLAYGELYRRARQVARELQRKSAVGQRALLLDSSESDYIVTFFGCLCAGVIAVPIYAPRVNKKGNARVESVVADAQPSVVLTAGAGSSAVRDVIVASAGEHVKWIDTNALPVDRDELWTPAVVSGRDVAFLQYTSGSTAAPKGVMVSHANILHNERMIQNAFDTKPGSVIVGWLPLYHDMGLIGNVLQPLFAGVPCILMSPVAFLQRPLRWLQAISRYQATTSGGPNFAYELCMRKIRPEDRAGLDLSSWRVAFNGAEPVRLETLNRFATQFADCGFRREAFVPCYGLAEATLFVSGGLDPNGVTAVNYGINGNGKNGSGNGAKVSRKQDKLLVACGRPPVEQAVRIVSSDSLQQCSDGDVGEIWISGPSVAQGYWRKDKETEETFHARIPGASEGPFLRTGDLGFIKEGHLVITGRLKDLLIIRGQNYYPQDIELTVEQSHPILQPGSGAAFSVEIEGEERLVVVQEVAVRKDPESIVQKDLDELDALIKLVSRNIVAAHELQPFAVVLIRKGTIPKTSSGKIQRHACRDAFLNRELYVLREWHERKQHEPVLPKISNPELDEHVPHGLASWLAQEIARIQGIDQERVDLNQPFAAYGLDSLAAIEFAHKLQTEFQVEVDIAEFFGDSTITEVIRRATDSTGKRVSKHETEQPAKYPLSYGQRALWFVHQTAPESAAYNIARVIRIANGLDVGALRLAFHALVDRHPCLRTIVVETTGEPVQKVAEKVDISFEYFDASEWSQKELEKALVQQSQRPFTLTLGPLFRTALYARSEKEYLLHVAVHHLVADYWTLTLLLDEVGKLYQASANKVEADLVPLEYSYADFVEWQREKLSGPDGQRLRDYWKNELAGELPPLSLPADHPRPPVQTFRGASFPFSLDASLTEALKRLGEKQQTTLFTTLLAAFQVLLYRLTSQEQVIVGCPIAGRSRAEFANTAGYFVNAVPMRADFQQRQTFTEFLSQVRNRVSKAFAHELYPFSLMVEQLGMARDPAVPPIFQSAFAFQQTYGNRSEDFVRFALGQPQAQVTLGGLQLEHVAVEQGTAQFDLTLTVGEGPDGIVGAWEYSSDLFDHSTVVRWSENFKVLLRAVAQRSDCREGRIEEIEILSAAERQQLLVEWNRTETQHSWDKCVHELFEEQAARTPQAVAVVDEDRELSYGELNRRANQLAHYLRKMGVGPDARVGICVERGFEMIVGLLAILKAGGAYVPLDPAYPPERLSYMLADSAPVVLLTQGHLAGLFPGISDTLPLLDLTDASAWSLQPQTNPQCAAVTLIPEHLAYVIYTSGSTGQPKGVAVEHRSLCNLIHWHCDAFALESGRRSSSLAGFGFDAATWEIWPTLCVGASLILAPSARTSDPEALLAWWKNQNIDVSFLPTPMAEFAFTRGITNSSLHTLLIGGDRLRQLPRYTVPFSLVNNYGPTETTVVATSGRIEPYAASLSIGRPIANTRIYVLDKCGEPVPVGVVGELYIGGAGVARGYLNRPELTAERFLADHFSPDAATRMYRTGDLGRWLADGTIEFVGRNDFQVKIRGFRIELGEIEAKLCEHPGVLEAVVIAREDTPGDKRLAAYATTRSGDSLDIQALRAHLAAALPEYMVPAAYMQLASFPLTPNGKLDRKALPAPEADAYVAHAYEAPQGTTETAVAGIWAEMLKIERAGRNDNFYDLGGHSLLATQVISRIRQVFGVEVPLRSFLETPTVAVLALLVDKAARTATPPLLPLPRRQHPRLSFAQERLWFLSRYEAQASLYTVPIAVRLRGALNVEAAKASLQEMVNRHEVLRTSFPEVGDGTIQDIAAEMEVPFAAAESREDELDQVLREQARRSFDLSHGPLIRASLFRIGSQDHVLLVVMHHIVSDGWSLGVMLREFNALYDSFSRGAASPLPPLPIQYADYSEWQREWLQGETLERQLDYWRKQLAAHETLNLPTDRPHSARPTLSGAMETLRLPQPLVSKLKLLGDQQGVTLFMTLLAGFEVLLYRYTGQTDISIGSGIANRNRQELEPLIGFFVNTLVLRTQFTEDSSVAELLRRVRDVSLQAYAHQDIPFERLVEALDPVREFSRTPFFQVLFALQNAPFPKVSWNGLEVTASILETGTAKFDLTLSAREEDGELELSLEYRTELFNAERMKRLLQHYRTLLEGIVVSVDARISELEILSEAERQQLLVEWNRTEPPYSTNRCVHDLFEEQAAKTPQAVAVRGEDGQVSYEELNRRANQLAHYLAKMGVGPEVRVGICMERGLEMMVGLLGVLKAGGAYVPLDPADPSARRSYMVKDAGAECVLTNERFTQQMAGCAEHVVDLEEAREEIEKQSDGDLNVHVDPENLAWVIYTSSSAGRPTGMAATHRSAVGLMQPVLIDATDPNLSVERWLKVFVPTEDTSYATYADVKLDEQGAVRIRRSQPNNRAYVLDGHMKPVPVGIKGELYLGGGEQARGYLNRPKLTAEKFVPDPFSQTSGGRLYRTGDLVRYQENGNLEFLGRLDSQVKIQGHRIGPEEIEAAVLDYSGVTQAAVIAREDEPGNLSLVGYVASCEGLDIDRLRGHLQQRLPKYMVPAALLQLDTLPLTPNGKVDRKALLELESTKAMEAGSLALTPTEELIAGVWSSLLGKSEIRRRDNFFDLGGHSLTSIQMLARLERVFDREIELRAIFEFPVLKDFSAYVDRLTGPAQLATLRAIVPTSRDRRLPLSFAQQRLWFLAQMEGASAAYHIPFGLHLKGDLDRTALGRALDRIVVRHEVLRTRFALLDGEPVQEIGAVEASSFRLIEHDLRGRNDAEAELAALSALEAGASFDLEAGPLIRGRLIRLAEDEHVLLITMHHIVSDGWSMGVLVSELNALYGAFLGGKADPLPELEIQYADYAVWQREWIEGEILQQQAGYWKTTLAGAPALLALPTDHTRPGQQSYAGAALPVVLEEELTSGLKGLSRRNGTTLYMTLLAGWAILLARLSGQQEVVIGSPVANRGRAEIEKLIGFFVNTLALRLDLSGSPRVSELLEQSKAQSLAAQRHQDIPFEQVVDLAQPVRSLAHSPLFQVMFAWQEAGESSLELPGLELRRFEPSPHRVAKFDMTLSLQAAGDTIGGVVKYASALFEAASVHRYIGYFQALLKAMVADDGQAIDRLPMLSEGEREQVLYEWNETKGEFPGGPCVHELFEEQVARTPQAVAVIYEEERLSYGELNERANRLAHYLRELGVGPESIVGLMVERNIEMVVALLGVLKAGAAYVPLDPGSVRERLKCMVEDSGARLVLSSGSLLPIIRGATDVEVLSLEAQEWRRYSNKELQVSIEPGQLAYVIYTSGSTGRPKGVGVEHRQLVNYVHAIGNKLQIEPGARLGLVSTYAADLGYTMMFPALCYGGCLDVVDASRVLDAGKLEEHFSRHPIDYLKIVPSHLRALLNSSEGSGVLPRRWLVLGGEASSWELIQQVKERRPGCRVLNHYGPTETTVGVLTYDTTQKEGGGGAEQGGMVPLGRPLRNGKVYVLDSELNPVGVGVSGEICIGGAGVARGYLQRAELTAEKFVANPYSEEAGGRMYRTGDLGRYVENGNIEFLGRKDHQVKIRGFRVELGEIEAALMEHPKIRQAVVVAREDESGDKRLVAYVVGEEEAGEGESGSQNAGLGISELREHMLGKLPEYMVPGAYMKLQKLPLTHNGKIDRKALPAPEQEAYAVRGYEAPVGEMETKLADVWAEVLKLEKVGRHDNFFELGGHSLLAVRVVSRLQQVLNVEVAIRDLFAHAELADLARHLEGAAHAELSRILPAKRSGLLPLSFAQQRLWFLAQMEGASAAYHIPFGLHLKGDLDRTALGRALDRIVVRHEVLRTRFALLDGEPVQEIGAVEASSFRLIEHDLRGRNDAEAELAALSALEAGASFDLEAGPLIRGRLIRLAEDEHVLLITMHHIVSDGWSRGVLVSELNALYGAFIGGKADPLPELEIQYADYAVWQREWIEGEILQQQAGYWKTTLAGAPSLLELPTDYTRPVQQDFAGGFVELILDEQLTAGLKDLSRRHGTTLYMTLLAGWAILLARLSGQQEVVIGSPVANRGRIEIEKLIGFFVNTLALRLDLSGSPRVSELLEQSKAQSLAAQRHQDIPFEQVVELAQPVRSLAHSPLFQVMFGWQNATEVRLELPGLEVQPMPSASYRMAKFDLTLSLRKVGERIVGALEYATALYERSTLERYREYFLRLVEAMAADDTQAVDHLRLLTETERHQVLYEWNATEREYPRDKCVHELFEEQVRRSPEATAVAWQEKELSYGELNARANRLAHYLRELGVGPEIRVAICAERSFEMIVGLLAILKAGGVYVPLDPSYPEERLKYMLADSAPAALLMQGHLARLAPGISETFPVLDLNDASGWGGKPEANPKCANTGITAENLAYIIYTSGSTGQPKGVMVPHRAINRLVLNNRYAKFEASDRVAFASNPAFDATTMEVWAPLLNGGSIAVIDQSVLLDAAQFGETLKRQAVNILWLTVGLFNQYADTLAEHFSRLRYLIVGGDALDPRVIGRMIYGNRPQHLLNGYGPTETTTFAITHEVNAVAEKARSIPIGRPIANTRAYILGEQGEPTPVGVIGELCIGGAGLARGYLNRAEWTAERFVPDPFTTEAGARIYRTGDLARWRPDGNIDFVGRKDFQTKIRGFRVELGEIEARLNRHAGVQEAAVIAREDTTGEKRLVAYYTASGIGEAEAASVGAERLRAHLSAVLPEYMVPAAYVRMERLPLTPSGKLDRKALPAPEQEAYVVRGYEEPVGEMETKLAKAWAEVLHLEKVGRRDNFFDLGGHSLTSIQMLARLERVFDREIELRAIFEFPVLKDFSAYVDRLTGPAQLATLRAIVPTSRDRRLPLSFAQQRLWFLAQMEGASAAYHIPFGLHLKGDLDRTALGRALDRIVVRHEVLRTRFALLDGEPVQEIGAVEASSFRLIEHDLRGRNDAEAELAALSALEAGASFDLEAGPLIRGRLIRLAEDEHVLLITMHHIVSDGWSMGVLVSELNALYGAFIGGKADPLPELEIQYADYAVWQREWIEGEILQQQAGYWKTTLAGAPALLALPTDHTRPGQQSYAGAALPVVLEEELTSGLKGLSRRNGTTLYMTLLAGWAILLARLSGQQEVVIGSPVANRGRAEIEKLIGFFVNTLALRLDLSGSPRVSELLEQSKAQSLAAQRHQDIPFEQVVDLAQPVRSLAHSPLFQVMFAWQNGGESSLELPGLELQRFEPSPHRVAKFDMTLSLQAAGDTIGGVMQYASALFESASVRRYVGYLRSLLKAMVADDTQAIDRLPMLSEGEREQVLYEWNETQGEFAGGQCVHELFEEQVARTPQAVAVIYEEQGLSYGELNERANRLAHYLRELGVGPESIVGLMVERNIEMVVALLGVLKAGAAYVPLDPGSVRERLKYMVEDSGARLVLSSGSLLPIIRGATDVEVLSLEAQEWRRYSNKELQVSIEPGQLAYVIYTSGSTGRPKGVGVEHRQLVNYVHAIGNKLQIEPGARLGLVSTYAADLGYTMMFPALCYGGCLDVVDASRVLDAGKLEEHFSRHPIDYLKIVPSHLRALLNSSEGSGVLPRRWLVLGGEASSWELIQQVKERRPGCRVLNHYGPTETTVGVLTYDTTQKEGGGGAEQGGMVPLGRPLRNGKVYVLDSELNPVGVGVSGEICIGGAGVARGYLQRAELTAEKFVANPYSEEAGGRMYRTGDLGRYVENGNIEFLGRKDHQVKIRGFRVELGEIEAALMEHPKIRQAVVVAREDESGDKRLVAYVVGEEEAGEGESGSQNAGLGISELREHMLGKLPEYMVPGAYMKLQKLPLTHNGKIDRKALPQPNPNTPEQEQEYVGPQDATQETLCRLWQQVLRRERVGIHDNFFMIGGHSLLAVQVISRIKSAFAIEMPLSLIFGAPTVARMAKEIAALNGHERPQSSPVLVSIQPRGSRSPFFCVHAVGGQVISYAELAQEMGLEQPFYGLQSPPANFSPESDISIEQMATLYNREIRSVQPVGPYLLSGWSMGGLVAWEMAQQLIKEGEIISLLALIDTAPPPKYREVDDGADEISMLARFASDMSRMVGKDPRALAEQFFQADAQDQWKMVQETLTSYGVLAPKTAHAEMTVLLDVYTRNIRAMNSYSIHTSTQAVVYFRASETPERFSELWTKWSGGGIQFHLVPGDHFTMLRRPNVRIIAETLQRYMSTNSSNESRAMSPEMSPVS